jgi:KDO2-lipid IV(A) lauroyltransferase
MRARRCVAHGSRSHASAAREKGSVYHVLVFVSRLLCLLPHWAAVWVARVGGSVWYSLAWRRRRVAKSNLVNAFPGWTYGRVCRTARASFVHFVRSLVVFLRGPLYGDPAYVARRIQLVGEEHMQAVHRQGRGVVLLLAHWGNWELGGIMLDRLGYAHSAVGRAVRSSAIMRFLNGMRARSGTRFIDKGRAARPTLAALKAGECVGFFVDQTTSERGAETTFFGRTCETTRGPAGFALKTRAPVVPVMCPLLADGRHEVRFYTPIPPPATGDPVRDVRELTQRLVSFVEARIRERPEQWLWSHRRWKPLDRGQFRPGFRHVETILVDAPEEPDGVAALRRACAYLKAAYPHSRLAVLAKAGLGPELGGDPNADEVIGYAPRQGLVETMRTIRRLRGRLFHVAVLLSGSRRAASWAALAGIPLRVGRTGQPGSCLLTHRAPRRKTSVRDDEACLEVAAVLARAGPS